MGTPFLLPLLAIVAAFPMLLNSLVKVLLFTSEERRKYREKNVFYQLQHPESEELRAIYREIDRDAMITEPDLLTPEKPKKPMTEIQSKLHEKLNEIVGNKTTNQFYVNLMWSPSSGGMFTEIDAPRQPVETVVKRDQVIVVSKVHFPPMTRSGRVCVAIFDSESGGEPLTLFNDVKSVRPNDRIVLNAPAVDAFCSSSPGAPEPEKLDQKTFASPEEAIKMMRHLQSRKEETWN